MSDRRSRSRAVRIAVGVFLGSAAVLGVIVWPQAIGAERLLVFAQLVALRGPLLIGLAAAAIVLVLIVVRSRRRRAVLIPVAAALALAAVLNAGVIAARGADVVTSTSAVANTVRILSWNTEHAAPGADAIAELIAEVDAEIVVLPETDEGAAADIVAALESEGRAVRHDTIDQDFPGSTPTSVLFIGDLATGDYRRSETSGSTPGQPSGVWEPTDPAAPIIAAVHTVPPMPWAMSLWSAGLDWVAGACNDPRAIVAGDLNATLDHMAHLGSEGGAIGRCRDAAEEMSSSARGSWPSALPELLSSPIDHILVGSAWEVVSFDVLGAEQAPGSDHRPIVAELAPMS